MKVIQNLLIFRFLKNVCLSRYLINDPFNIYITTQTTILYENMKFVFKLSFEILFFLIQGLIVIISIQELILYATPGNSTTPSTSFPSMYLPYQKTCYHTYYVLSYPISYPWSLHINNILLTGSNNYIIPNCR